MQAADVASLFTGRDGSYLFARWDRPIVPVVFGVDDATLSVVKGAFEAVVALTGHKMADLDPEFGANLLMFFVREWSELRQVPGLDNLVPDLPALCDRLAGQGTNQYRQFRFEPSGSIKAAFVFVVMDEALSQTPVADLALVQAVRVICLWSDRAFATVSPLARVGQNVILRPEIAQVIKIAYDPVLPPVARDASHALRIIARLGRTVAQT